MKKIAFVGNGEPPSKLLEIFKKQTPGRSGVWGELQGVDNYRDADYYMVIDWLPADSGIDSKKCIFLGAHPETVRPYRDMSGYTGLKMFDCKKTFGFGEWWLNLDYDYLKALQPPQKTKQLGCIMSNADNDKSHILRRAWLDRFTSKIDSTETEFNLYGRINPFTSPMKKYYHGALGSSNPHGAASTGGNDHMSGKEQVYLDHKYMLEFDNIGEYYFSERIFDSILLYAMPIYWGGRRLHQYIGENSFKYLNIEGDGNDVLDIANSDFYERHIDDLAKARNILLDELQLWPRTHEAIFGTFK